MFHIWFSVTNVLGQVPDRQRTRQRTRQCGLGNSRNKNIYKPILVNILVEREWPDSRHRAKWSAQPCKRSLLIPRPGQLLVLDYLLQRFICTFCSLTCQPGITTIGILTLESGTPSSAPCYQGLKPSEFPFSHLQNGDAKSKVRKSGLKYICKYITIHITYITIYSSYNWILGCFPLSTLS